MDDPESEADEPKRKSFSQQKLTDVFSINEEKAVKFQRRFSLNNSKL